MCGTITVEKYGDPENPVVTAHIRNIFVANTLIDQGSTVNMMTTLTMEILKLPILRPTPMVLELTNHSNVKLAGILEDVIVSLDSWEYPIDFLVVTPKCTSGEHPMILGRP